MKVTNTSFQRKMNMATVMKVIRDYGEISRSDIARNLSCNKSTISNIVTYLFMQGILVNISEGKSGPSGGRKSVKIGINKNYGCILGIDLEVNLYRAVLINLDGEIIFSATKEITLNSSNFEAQIITIINQLIKEAGQYNIPLIGIGMGFPGFISPKDGIVHLSVDFELDEFDFHRKVASKFDIPIVIENNANCCAWGILQQKRNKTPGNFIYVLPLIKSDDEQLSEKRFNIVVGLGIVINYKVYYGANFAAGELVSAFQNQATPDQFAVRYFFSKCDEDMAKLKELFHELSVNLFVIARVLNPDVIFLGGVLTQYQELFVRIWNDTLDEKPNLNFKSPINFEFSPFPNHEVAYGAATMFLESLFSLPDTEETNMLSEIDWDYLFKRMSTGNSSV